MSQILKQDTAFHVLDLVGCHVNQSPAETVLRQYQEYFSQDTVDVGK